jgi:hypothetical protein
MMSELRKAAEQALTVLVDIDKADSDRDFLTASQCAELDRTMEALRDALQSIATATYDQQELELCDVCGWKAVIPDDGCLNCQREAALKLGEPVAFIDRANLKELKTANGMRVWAEGPNMYFPANDCEVPIHLVAVYTAPPAQPVPPRLTDEEVQLLWISGAKIDIRTIETAVRKQIGINDD